MKMNSLEPKVEPVTEVVCVNMVKGCYAHLKGQAVQDGPVYMVYQTSCSCEVLWREHERLKVKSFNIFCAIFIVNFYFQKFRV